MQLLNKFAACTLYNVKRGGGGKAAGKREKIGKITKEKSLEKLIVQVICYLVASRQSVNSFNNGFKNLLALAFTNILAPSLGRPLNGNGRLKPSYWA
jgi:CDP-diglyceride synthetase